MGARLLRQWLLRPLLDSAAIARRQDAVASLVEDPAARAALGRRLAGIGDLERLTSRAALGVAHARDLLLTGRSVGAEEALRMGLISRVVPHERLREEAVAAAESILRTAPEARLHVKRILHERYGRVDRMTMDWSLFRGPEAREGMRAFAEKRAPSWVPKGLATGKRL